MNRLSLHFLISLLIICMMLVLVVLFASCGGPYQHSKNQHGDNQSSITEGNSPPLPTPDSARTTYTNAQYGYSIRYPTQWYFTSSDDKSFVRVFLKHDLSVPEAVAFEIRCFTNSNKLDSLTIWKQTQPTDGSEVAVGTLTFLSGAVAFVAQGQGQTPYRVYTMTHKRVACQIVTFQTDPLNAQVVLVIVNSFNWQ